MKLIVNLVEYMALVRSSSLTALARSANIAGEVILESVLEALVQALIVRACIGHIDLLCSFCKQGDMVLAAQEVGGIIAVCDLFHGLLVVGVILRIQSDLLHNGFVAGQLLRTQPIFG